MRRILNCVFLSSKCHNIAEIAADGLAGEMANGNGSQ